MAEMVEAAEVTAGDEFVHRITEALRTDPRVLAAWLTGSHARGTADGYSDVDMVVAVTREDYEDFVADWPPLSDRVAPSVLRERVFGSTFTHITPEWQRWDVSIISADDVRRRSRSTMKLVFDRAALDDRLAAPGPVLLPDPAKLTRLVTEFLRVLGLLPVVAGRGEYVVGTSGAGLLRGMTVQLFMEDVAVEDRGGSLRLNSLLPPDRLQTLADLPGVSATRAGVIAAHLACARAFLPVARDMAERTGADWPTELETALRARLRAELDVEI